MSPAQYSSINEKIPSPRSAGSVRAPNSGQVQDPTAPRRGENLLSAKTRYIKTAKYKCLLLSTQIKPLNLHLQRKIRSCTVHRGQWPRHENYHKFPNVAVSAEPGQQLLPKLLQTNSAGCWAVCPGHQLQVGLGPGPLCSTHKTDDISCQRKWLLINLDKFLNSG